MSERTIPKNDSDHKVRRENGQLDTGGPMVEPTPVSPPAPSSADGASNPVEPKLDPAPTPTTRSVSSKANGPPNSCPPPIEAEPSDTIDRGAGGKLEVPYEDLSDELDDGDELDLTSGLPKKLGKPNRRDWIAINPLSEFQALLLLHKPNPDGVDVEHYYVDKALRGPIRTELKLVRIIQYYSFRTKTIGLLAINVTPGNSWYESLAPLLKLPADFIATHAFRIMSDKTNDRYKVKAKPLPSIVPWPTTSTNVLLGETIGADRFINSPQHPMYVSLTEGVDLDL